MLVAGMALAPVFALAAGTTTAPAAHSRETTARLANLKSRAGEELDRRSQNLERVLAAVPGIKNLSAGGVAAIQKTLQNNLAALAALKNKIDADADLAALRSDVEQITGSYRIYALVVPQLRIIVAADRAVTVVQKLRAFSALLAARVRAAESAGAAMGAAQANLADLDAKIADAEAAARAAVGAIGALQPDQSGTPPFGKNLAAFKDARAKIVAAHQALAAARADAGAVVAAVKGKSAAAPNAASTTPAAAGSGQ